MKYSSINNQFIEQNNTLPFLNKNYPGKTVISVKLFLQKIKIHLLIISFMLQHD